MRASGSGNNAPGTVNTSAAAHVDREKIQQLVDDLKARLGIPDTIELSIDSSNPRMVSVQPTADHAFRLSFEKGFVELLGEDELKATIAHELGHVWIFTHFPYLQTEELANTIALRVVSRDSLAPVYAKAWDRAGASGNLNTVLPR
jgi:hypothetical protein